jgi:hypothetical protein
VTSAYFNAIKIYYDNYLCSKYKSQHNKMCQNSNHKNKNPVLDAIMAPSHAKLDVFWLNAGILEWSLLDKSINTF